MQRLKRKIILNFEYIKECVITKFQNAFISKVDKSRTILENFETTAAHLSNCQDNILGE